MAHAIGMHGTPRWPGCPESPDESSFNSLISARASGGQIYSLKDPPLSLGVHELQESQVTFLWISGDKLLGFSPYEGLGQHAPIGSFLLALSDVFFLQSCLPTEQAGM